MKKDRRTEIELLGRLCGILPVYRDNAGRRHPTSSATYEALLDGMGVPWEKAAARREEIARRQAQTARLLPPVTILWPGRRRPHLLAAVKASQLEAAADLQAHGELVAEDGSRSAFAVRLAASPRARVRKTGEGQRLLVPLPLPLDLPPGYYDLHLEVAAAGRAEAAHTRLIAAPPTAYLPECLAAGRRLFGLNVPLYALRRALNWGMGDFGDLEEAVAWAQELGAAFVGVNPLHAPLPEAGTDPSPYSPATRLFTNFLYLDVPAVPEFSHCPEARAFLASPEGADLLSRLRAAALVDYPQVYLLKERLLRELYRTFRRLHGGGRPQSGRGREFCQFVTDQGQILADFACYAALAEELGSGDWRRWPPPYQDRDNPAVAAFAAGRPERLEFWQYVQWLASGQLARVRHQALKAGLALGLYQDLALGAAPGGFETWAFPRLFARETALGAPPDAFNPKGQNWGLPPLIPHRLRESGYELFIRTLRANLPPGGMLRLDHVMGLFRLFWIAARGTGAYVRYAAPELLAILALESHRCRTLIIGEDLGTVAPGIRRELARRRIFSYKVFIFEREADGSFRPPHRYPVGALAAVTTHDLPTLAGYWQGKDIALKKRHHLYPEPRQADFDLEARALDRGRLVAALAAQGLLPGEDLARLEACPTLPPAVGLGVLEFLGKSRAALMEVRLEEVFGLTAQQNLPGTVKEHPNWRQKFPLALEEMRRRREAAVLARRLAAVRGQSAEPAEGGREL